MSADWSVRRRQTLGEVLNHGASSQIPQPSSVFIGDRELNGMSSQVCPDELINRDLRHEIRSTLMRLREQLDGEVHKQNKRRRFNFRNNWIGFVKVSWIRKTNLKV